MQALPVFRNVATCVAITLIAAIVAGQAGCSPESTPAPQVSSVVGDMNNLSYYGQRGTKFRPNANGEMVCVDQFEGRFVWADYAAPWCGPCTHQSRDIKQLDGSCGEDVIFLTVLTSDMGGYGDPATRATAASWSRQFGIDPALVLAADLTSTTIPKHILFSPDGQVLFEQTGQMSADQIRATLAQCRQQWQAWKVTEGSGHSTSLVSTAR